jgi:hypothetical protein
MNLRQVCRGQVRDTRGRAKGTDVAEMLISPSSPDKNALNVNDNLPPSCGCSRSRHAFTSHG